MGCEKLFNYSLNLTIFPGVQLIHLVFIQQMLVDTYYVQCSILCTLPLFKCPLYGQRDASMTIHIDIDLLKAKNNDQRITKVLLAD
jgi:hypothetical protein